MFTPEKSAILDEYLGDRAAVIERGLKEQGVRLRALRGKQPTDEPLEVVRQLLAGWKAAGPVSFQDAETEAEFRRLVSQLDAIISNVMADDEMSAAEKAEAITKAGEDFSNRAAALSGGGVTATKASTRSGIGGYVSMMRRSAPAAAAATGGKAGSSDPLDLLRRAVARGGV